MEKKDLKSMTLEELTEFVKELGEKPFRAKQLYQWMPRYCEDVPPLAYTLARKFWPGPLTMILKRKPPMFAKLCR